MANKAFWHACSLSDLSETQWEQLCDGCGKCCLHKLEDEDTGEMYLTSVSCAFLNANTCQCTVYERRKKHVPECVQLIKEDLTQLDYMPSTCSYKLIHEGHPLPEWHPLVSGDPNSVHRAHVSVRNKCINEREVDEEEMELYIVERM